MPTSRLIDINTAAITYRTKCLTALDKHLYRNCIGAIISLNAELPEDTEDQKYRIVFDTEQYYQKIKDSFIIVCTGCDAESPHNSTVIHEINLSKQDQILLGNNTREVWVCTKCKRENDLTESKIINDTLQKPYYHRVVPEPPELKTGLLSQTQFHKEMVDWVWLCLNSLEDGFTKFRDDNWNKKDDYDSLFDIDTSAEETA
jgi:hypothetical protein